MNQNIKNILGGVIAVAVLALGYAALSYVNSYSKVIEPSSFRSFSVTGDGKATAIPDIAEFSFQVITEGGVDITALQTKNTEAMNKVIGYVKTQGVAEKDIKTQYYNVEPRYQTSNCRITTTPLLLTPAVAPDSISGSSGSSFGTVNQTCPPPSIVGYTITQSVDVKIRDFSKIGDIMGGVVKNGANQVGSLSFTIDDQTKVQDEARTEAIIKAMAKAESIADAGNFKVGRLLNIQEGGQYPMYNTSLRMESAAKLDATGAAPAPVIQPGSQEVNVNVTLQYEIK